MQVINLVNFTCRNAHALEANHIVLSFCVARCILLQQFALRGVFYVWQ